MAECRLSNGGCNRLIALNHLDNLLNGGVRTVDELDGLLDYEGRGQIVGFLGSMKR